jgi:hypothetical protein
MKRMLCESWREIPVSLHKDFVSRQDSQSIDKHPARKQEGKGWILLPLAFF